MPNVKVGDRAIIIRGLNSGTICEILEEYTKEHVVGRDGIKRIRKPNIIIWRILPLNAVTDRYGGGRRAAGEPGLCGDDSLRKLKDPGDEEEDITNSTKPKEELV